jgi:hypothetical protein
MMGNTIYVSAATVSAEVANIGMGLAGLLGHDTNEKHPRVAIHRIMSTPIFLSGIDIADQ